MIEGMVPDHMPGFHQLANNIRTLLRVAADQEKCGVDIVPGKDFQQAQGMRIVGPVVISERQLLRPAAQPGEGTAEPLPGRRHGLIARG